MLLSCGDALIDFLPVKSAAGRDATVPVAAGFCLNIPVGMWGVEQMNAFAAAADIVRMSDVDFEFLYGGSDHAERAKSLIKGGASLVVVTRGIKGAQAWHREAAAVEVEAPTVDVVDTIGAGDSFQAALLFALRALGRIGRQALAQINCDELDRCCHLLQAARPSPAGAPAPIRRDDRKSARHCLASFPTRASDRRASECANNARERRTYL